jgi:hypothetical protein
MTWRTGARYLWVCVWVHCRDWRGAWETSQQREGECVRASTMWGWQTPCGLCACIDYVGVANTLRATLPRRARDA